MRKLYQQLHRDYWCKCVLTMESHDNTTFLLFSQNQREGSNFAPDVSSNFDWVIPRDIALNPVEDTNGSCSQSVFTITSIFTITAGTFLRSEMIWVWKALWRNAVGIQIIMAFP